MAGRKPPILRPTPTIFPIAPQGGQRRDGKDLWRDRLRTEYNRQRTGAGVHDLWVRHAKALPDEAARDDYFNQFYSDLPSSVIRAWERESHQRWPPPWTSGLVNYLDVYVNEDEIYYTKEASEWSLNEVQIRNMYREDFGTLLNEFQAWFVDLAERITRARGWAVPYPRLGPVAPPGVSDNGILPPTQSQSDDIATLPNNLRNEPGTWQLGACYWGVGSYGIISVWRLVDASGRTMEKIFLKRDGMLNDYVGNKERQLLLDLRLQGAPEIIPYLLGQHQGTPTQFGRTWLNYAIYGDLSQLLEFYRERHLVIPEAFIWYLFHTLARALDFIEKGHEPGQVPVRPWQPMFHYDFKPGNILLDAPDPNGPDWCSYYPLPVLADFGGAETYPHPGAPDQIPSHVRGLGTRGFSPFELFQPNSQRLSNDERANGPARDTPMNAQGVLQPPRRPTARARKEPYKPPLPVDQQVRIHSSIYQLGVTLWCTMTNRVAPRGQVCAWRGAYEPNDNLPVPLPARLHNAYPAWWDRPPRHAPRRPWPWKVAKPLRKKEWKALVDRWLVEVPLVEYGPLHARKTRTRPLPAGLDRLGARPKSWTRQIGGGMWVPLAPMDSLKPRYSDRLVDLVYKCMSPLIADRPTTDGLLLQTQREMTALQSRYPNGSGMGPEALHLPPDKFPIGQHTLNDVWRP